MYCRSGKKFFFICFIGYEHLAHKLFDTQKKLRTIVTVIRFTRLPLVCIDLVEFLQMMAFLRSWPKDGLLDSKGLLSLLSSTAIATSKCQVIDMTSEGKKHSLYSRYTPEEHYDTGHYASELGTAAALCYFFNNFEHSRFIRMPPLFLRNNI